MTKPRSPSDPRPDGPEYISDECEDCGSTLEPFLEALIEGFHDEFICPDCDDGIYLDVPDYVQERIESTFSEPFEVTDED